MEDSEVRARVLQAFNDAFDAHRDSDSWETTRRELFAQLNAHGVSEVDGIAEFCEELVEAIHDRTPIRFEE